MAANLAALIRTSLEAVPPRAAGRIWIGSALDVAPTTRQALEADPRAAGLIEPGDPEAVPDSGGRVGSFRLGARAWRLPRGRARLLVFVGPVSALPTRMLVDMWLRGVHTILRMGASGSKRWRTASVIARRVLQVEASRIGRWVIRLSAPKSLLRLVETDGGFRSLASGASRSSVAPADHGPPRVLLVSDALGPGGAERQLVLTAEALGSSGAFAPEVVSLNPADGLFADRLRETGILPRQLVAPETLDGLRWADAGAAALDGWDRLPSKLATRICALESEIRRVEPVVVHGWLDVPSIVAGYAGIFAGVPRVILGARNLAPDTLASAYESTLRPAYRALLEHPSVTLLANSHAGARDYERWLGLPHGRVAVVWNGVAPELLEPAPRKEVQAFRAQLGIPPSAPLVGTVCRFEPQKRPLLWLRVATAVARSVPDAHFVLTGRGRLERKMREWIDREGLTSRIHLVSPRRGVPTVVGALDVLLLTSSIEGLPNVVLEAQAQGVAVIATDAGGSREALDPGRGGWIVPVSASPAEIAGEVLRVIGDAGARGAARSAGPEFVRKYFSVAAMRDATIAAYRSSAR